MALSRHAALKDVDGLRAQCAPKHDGLAMIMVRAVVACARACPRTQGLLPFRENARVRAMQLLSCP